MDAIRFGRLSAGVKRDWDAHKARETELGRRVQAAGMEAKSVVTYPEATTETLRETVESLVEFSQDANETAARLRRYQKMRKTWQLPTSIVPLQLAMMLQNERAALAEIRDAVWQRILVFQHPENSEALLQALDERPERISPVIARDLLEIRTLPEPGDVHSPS